MENKICQQCAVNFVVTGDDLAFLVQMAPEISNHKFTLPVPENCPDCRMRELMMFRNGWVLYRRKCDLTGKEMVSMFSPVCKYKVYHRNVWYSDQWDPLKYGRDYDFNRPFFDQLQELFLQVPLFHASTVNDENSDFSNNSGRLMNCYMVQDSEEAKDCLYCNWLVQSQDCVDCGKVVNTQGCYQVLNGLNCYGCYYSENIINCRESYWLYACTGCRSCFGCINLNNKEYYIFNEPKSRNEYEKFVKKYQESDRTYRQEVEKLVRELWRREPHRYAQIYASEDCSGDFINYAKKVESSQIVDRSENVRYCNMINRSKNFMDVCAFGLESENIYCCASVGLSANNLCFCNEVWENVTNVYYSWFCGQGVRDCFGCAGLRGKQYCVLNKQYSREEYEKLVAQIIEHMQKTGEWGRFFPIKMSPFGYNETIANEYYPLNKEQTVSSGANWYDKPDPNYEFDEFYHPLTITNYNPQKNSHTQLEIEKCLKGVIKCEVTGRPFKIISQELYFYIKHSLPLPVVHPDERRRLRNQNINRAKFYNRKCDCSESGHRHEGNDRCEVKFETTYAPSDKLRIYCENCYQKSVI